MIHKFSRYLLTLVALLAMTTGAWADKGTLLTTINASSDFTDGSKTFDNIVTVTLDAVSYSAKDGWYNSDSPHTVSVAPVDGVTVTGYTIYFSKTNPCEVEASSFTAYLINDGVYADTGMDNDLGSVGITKIEVYGPAAPEVEVEISTDQQSAEFDMPSFDATLEYQIVRNLASNVGITVNGKQAWGETAASIQVKKQNGEYPAAASTLEVSLIDILQNNATIESSNYTWKLQRLADDGQTWTDLTLAEAKLSPGTYSIVAEAVDVDGALYGGGTSCEFDVIEGYEITVAAGEYATYYNNVALTIEDADAEMYTISNVTDTEAQLSDKLSIAPKETPLLIYNKGTEAKTFLLIPTTTEAADVTVAKEFCGTAEAKEMPASNEYTDYYVCTGKAFIWVKEAGQIAANRCWLQIGEQPAASRTRTRSITGGSDTTGINAVDSEQWTDDSYYDLQGRKVTQPNRKGIYIKNGQKVILR